MQMFLQLLFSIQQNRWQRSNKTEVFNTAVVIAKKKMMMALDPDTVQTQTSDIP